MHSASDHGYSIEGQLPGPSKPEPNPIRVYNLHIEHSLDPVVYTVPFLDRGKAERYAQAHAAFHWPEHLGRPATLQWGQSDVNCSVPPGHDHTPRACSEAISRPRVSAIKFVLVEWWL